ncbi:GNAT family N-acetyltransferase [Thiorhodovibrio litoralis]|uniref:GNAT family N-acetyltransferase n=1 Tax=Thiorhodovibrio litoralis TaxID=2952932 RepID=UPI002B260C71|nr:GNAT family N-acetyltransferase [Thiorhodovibrio litoralis]WPL14174.1 Spermidine N(1)-acetyltransferase [Thiorhodovibrio litoralis]
MSLITPCNLVRQDGVLAVRPVRIQDADALFPAMADPALSRFLAWAPHVTVEETRSVLAALEGAQSDGKAWHWTVLLNDHPVGLVSLIDVRRTHRTWRLDRAEMAYWIAPEAQGCGLASRASAMVADLAFGSLGLEKLLIANAKDNPSSGRVAERLGARIIGTELRAFEKDGCWHNLIWRELHRRPAEEESFV